MVRDVSDGRLNPSVSVAVLALVFLFLTGFGLHMIWHSTVTLPRQYDRLAGDGLPATARVDTCARGLGGGHGVACRLTLPFEGAVKTWVYPENSAQFEELPVGSPVAMLVDPRHPSITYTVTDVRAHTNAGFGIVAGFGLFFACLGLSGIGFVVWLARWWRRRSQVRWD